MRGVLEKNCQVQQQQPHHVLLQKDNEQVRVERIKELEALLENERSSLQNEKNKTASTNHESTISSNDDKFLSRLGAAGVQTQPTPGTRCDEFKDKKQRSAAADAARTPSTPKPDPVTCQMIAVGLT
jgi:hypothetical protein